MSLTYLPPTLIIISLLLAYFIELRAGRLPLDWPDFLTALGGTSIAFGFGLIYYPLFWIALGLDLVIMGLLMGWKDANVTN